MERISWGIIGCGDVTEVKSGPAFNKVPGSSLHAVMRRDETKVKDYANRHQVPRWYTSADDLINDPEVNAIYVATPPSSHLDYALAAIDAGKPVYLEKPMTLNASEADRLVKAAEAGGSKVTIAHYRRAQPLFMKIRNLLEEKSIGEIRYITLELNKQRLSPGQLAMTGNAWRVDEAVAGGGLFNDLAPHQLDILYTLFGDTKRISSMALNQSGLYKAPDLISTQMLFERDIVFSGTWCFSAGVTVEKDSCTITGDTGSIKFSFFSQRPVVLTRDGREEVFEFSPLQHVQQPMIERVVDYFLEKGTNPCPPEEGKVVMQWIDQINKG